MPLDTIGPESTGNLYALSLRAATDQKAGGSNPSRRAIGNPRIPREYGDFSLFFLFSCVKSLISKQRYAAVPQQIPLTDIFSVRGIS